MLRNSSLCRAGSALLVMTALGLGGCSTGDMAMLTTISGGEKLRVPLGVGGVVRTEEAGVKIDGCGLIEKPEKKLTYVFDFTDSRKRALRSVKVEDVADSAPIVLIEETNPTLTAAGLWHGELGPLNVTDPRLSWLATISNTLRVYRFTLTFADGKTQVLLQGTMYPQALKSAIRQKMGQNY